MDGFCRACLIKYDEPTALLQYTERTRRLFIYMTGVQVKRNDAFPFQLCKDCYLHMKQGCKFKKQCRTSDKRYRNYVALKDVGGTTDFCTFLKNSENSLFRLPMLMSGSSTPFNQKPRDDDNESTTASIRNFIADMLPPEGIPDTEDQIIREVIEEEADLLDDSLDSHWLQDDRSIDNDFRLDLSFSPFSTPRSIENDHCYTPNRIDENEDKQNNYVPSTYHANYDKDKNHVENLFNLDKTNYDEHNFKAMQFCKDTLTKDINKPAVSDITTANNQCEMIYTSKENSKIFHYYTNVNEDGIHEQPNENIILSESLDDLELGTTFGSTIELETVRGKVELSKALKELEPKKAVEKDIIDKNLSKALLNEDVKEFNLQDLLNSPVGNEFTHINTSPSSKRIMLFGKEMQSKSPKLDKSLDMDATQTSMDRIIDNFLKNDNENECDKDISLDVQNFKVDLIFDQITKNIEDEDQIKDNKNTVDDEFHCELCGLPFKDVHEIIEHNVEYHKIEVAEHIQIIFDTVEDKGQDCVVCSINFGSFRLLKHHLFRYHKIDPVSFVSKNEIDIQKSDFKEFFDISNKYCKKCDKTFATEGRLKLHAVNYHHIKISADKGKRRKGDFICGACGKIYTDSSNLIRHLKAVHDQGEKREHKCDICYQIFTTENRLKQHKKTHNKPNYQELITKKTVTGLFMCDICGKSSSSLSAYNLHLRRHRKQFDCYCDECGRGFVSKYELVVHLRMHMNIKPYQCKLCSKHYRRRHTLNEHIHLMHDVARLEDKIARSEGDFECETCHKRFTTKRSVSRHTLNGYCKKRICDECGKVCLSPAELMNHKDVFHKTVQENLPDAALEKVKRKEEKLKEKLKKTEMQKRKKRRKINSD